MSDRQLIGELIVAGLTQDEATWAVEKVCAAIALRIRAGRTVQIDGVGRLGARTKRNVLTFHEGKRAKVAVTVTCLKSAVEIGRSTPEPLS